MGMKICIRFQKKDLNLSFPMGISQVLIQPITFSNANILYQHIIINMSPFQNSLCMPYTTFVFVIFTFVTFKSHFHIQQKLTHISCLKGLHTYMLKGGIIQTYMFKGLRKAYTPICLKTLNFLNNIVNLT